MVSLFWTTIPSTAICPAYILSAPSSPAWSTLITESSSFLDVLVAADVLANRRIPLMCSIFLEHLRRIVRWNNQIISGICTEKCLNGGKCIQKDVCMCPKGYFGFRCEFCEYKRYVLYVATNIKFNSWKLLDFCRTFFSQMCHSLFKRRQVQRKQHL